MHEPIIEPIAGIYLFPEAETVFSDNIEKHAYYLNPLVSIDLSLINPEWQGLIHLLSPIEPNDGYVGDYAPPEACNYYLRPNWIGFKMDENHRYTLMGDFRFFAAENGGDADLKTFYIVQHESYNEAKQQFKQQQKLYSVQSYLKKYRKNKEDFSEEEPSEIFEQLGGMAQESNWVQSTDFPLNYHQHSTDDDNNGDDIYPLAEDGKRFYFIASVKGWSYRDTGADSILLFYEPENKIALLTFDWT